MNTTRSTGEEIRGVFEALGLASDDDRASFADPTPRHRRRLDIVVGSSSNPFKR
ncbi:hypothetical protein [Tsukamurella sputi]|uniref:hypothetical protein n=1 Tax=Tsukamurella sputi TaxID=2591848 RepID=UPI0013159D19|nr:hypothetical protein [Tsukamurella sputi]